jgi:hypothetical protein
VRAGAGQKSTLALALASLVACARPSVRGTDGHPACGSLAAPACDRARALAFAATTYEDESHDYVLVPAPLGFAPPTALAQTPDGWRPLPLACARAPREPRPTVDPRAVDYTFIGATVDATLVSADADVGPLLARPEPHLHDVRLVALAFVHDLASPPFAPGPAVVERPNGDCTCSEATHFAGATKYGAMLAYDFTLPPRAPRAPHVRALDVVRAALADPRVVVHESQIGRMTIDGLGRALAREAAVPLTFRVTDAAPVAYAVSPVAELCDFPAPALSPSPLDFGIAPYGTEARRSVHAVNRSPVDLRALVGASTFVLPAGGAIDIPLRWTPDGDAPGCEIQTRDEAIPFLRLRGGSPRAARVLETVRTGRPSVERSERLSTSAPNFDFASTARDWSCPRDFVRTSCRAENAVGSGAVAEPRADEGCHFTCAPPSAGGAPTPCRFDALMSCALNCRL